MIAKTQNERKLVRIQYYRNDQKDHIKCATVTERQAYDIRILLPHINITGMTVAPQNSERDYVLL